MAITEEKLKELIDPNIRLEKISKISSDGNNLLTRIPKAIEEELKIKKGNKIRWVVEKDNKEIKIQLLEDGK